MILIFTFYAILGLGKVILFGSVAVAFLGFVASC